MELKIEKDSRIKDLQQEFNTHFPYLKIEFLRNKAASGHHSAKMEKAAPFEFVRELTRLSIPATIDIDRKKTVKEMEEDFQEHLRLNIKIFRRSGNSWVDPSLTDNWSLDKQNNEGEAFRLY